MTLALLIPDRSLTPTSPWHQIKQWLFVWMVTEPSVAFLHRTLQKQGNWLMTIEYSMNILSKAEQVEPFFCWSLLNAPGMARNFRQMVWTNQVLWFLSVRTTLADGVVLQKTTCMTNSLRTMLTVLLTIYFIEASWSLCMMLVGFFMNGIAAVLLNFQTKQSQKRWITCWSLSFANNTT